MVHGCLLPKSTAGISGRWGKKRAAVQCERVFEVQKEIKADTCEWS